MLPIPLLHIVRVLLLALLLAGTTARADEASDLAQRVYDRPNGRDLTTLGRMMLTEKGRAPRIRELVTNRLEKGHGETANLPVFVPATGHADDLPSLKAGVDELLLEGGSLSDTPEADTYSTLRTSA